ncbi:MAG: hypothetical protein KDH96_02310 [Candidatus Riesia sp.]|nr:hypothetical protein [Candidatus Riesia sp.]
MSSPIIALYCVYNEAENIERSIRSVASFCSEVRVYDGAFAKYPHASASSNDGTEEIVLNLNAELGNVRWIPCEKAYESQMQKRTLMLQQLPPESVGLIIDGDEWIANPSDFDSSSMDGYDIGWVTLCSNLYVKPYSTPRLFRGSIEGLHYAGRHHWIYDAYGRLVCSHRNLTHTYRHTNVSLRMFNRRLESKESFKRTFRRNRNPLENRYDSELDVYKVDKQLLPASNPAAVLKHPTFVLKPPKKPKCTLMALFSRPWAVSRWMNHFSKVDLPWEDTEILALVDNRSGDMLSRVKSSLLKMFGHKANGIRVYCTRNQSLPESSNVGSRRDRIVENWNTLLPDIQGDLVFGAEDDTLPDTDAYRKMLKAYVENKAGFIQATIIGRWSLKIIPHWQILSDERGNPVRVSSAVEGSSRLIDISGAGWFCFITSRENLQRFPLKWTGGLKNPGPPMGPDLWFGYNLHKAGIKCLGDWSVGCLHFTKDKDLHPSSIRKAHRLAYQKSEKGVWNMYKEEIAAPSMCKRFKEGVESGKETETDMGVKYRVLRPFAGTEGRFFKGGTVEVESQTRAQKLMNKGLIGPLEDDILLVGPSETKVMAPAERKVVVTPAPSLPMLEVNDPAVAEAIALATSSTEESSTLESFLEEPEPEVVQEAPEALQTLQEPEQEEVQVAKWERVSNGVYRNPVGNQITKLEDGNWELQAGEEKTIHSTLRKAKEAAEKET